jgi:transposase-like protein
MSSLFSGVEMAAGDITFIECPFGDLFPVRKTAPRAWDFQHIECPRCGHTFEILLEESVERLSQEHDHAVAHP